MTVNADELLHAYCFAIFRIKPTAPVCLKLGSHGQGEPRRASSHCQLGCFGVSMIASARLLLAQKLLYAPGQPLDLRTAEISFHHKIGQKGLWHHITDVHWFH